MSGELLWESLNYLLYAYGEVASGDWVACVRARPYVQEPRWQCAPVCIILLCMYVCITGYFEPPLLPSAWRQRSYNMTHKEMEIRVGIFLPDVVMYFEFTDVSTSYIFILNK